MFEAAELPELRKLIADQVERDNEELDRLLAQLRVAKGDVRSVKPRSVSTVTLLSRGVAHVIDQVLVWFCFTVLAPSLSW
jgi:predicted RecB family nuclease